MKQFYLQKHAYLGVTGQSGIVLDLRRGEYVGLNPRQMDALRHIVEGWPASQQSDQPKERARSEDALAVAATLTKRGLLTDSKWMGRDAAPTRVDEVEMQLADFDRLPRPRIRVSHWTALLRASVFSRLSLRLRSTGSVLRYAKRRKHQKQKLESQPSIEVLRELVLIFLYLRTYFFTHRDKCLFDSFVLIEFLAHFDLYPEWVIAVKGDPFAAHSWVQHGRYILNGRPEQTQGYTPILAI